MTDMTTGIYDDLKNYGVTQTGRCQGIHLVFVLTNGSTAGSS